MLQLMTMYDVTFSKPGCNDICLHCLQIRDYLLPYVRACVLSGDAGHAALTAPGWGLITTAEQSKTWLKQLQEVAGEQCPTILQLVPRLAVSNVLQYTTLVLRPLLAMAGAYVVGPA